MQLTNTLGMQFVHVAPGEFLMGSPPAEQGRKSEETLHHVKITKPFLMATTAVTQAQWSAVMGSNPSKFHGDNRPVETVSWNDAVAFCEKLSAKEGKHFRLPTEAEWEYACRAGTQTAFGGTNNLDEMGWHKDNSNDQTHPVAQKKPNAWGLYDMQGNVHQWCSDGYGPYGGDAVDPKGANDARTRVVRGGAWKWNRDHLRRVPRQGRARRPARRRRVPCLPGNVRRVRSRTESARPHRRARREDFPQSRSAGSLKPNGNGAYRGSQQSRALDHPERHMAKHTGETTWRR